MSNEKRFNWFQLLTGAGLFAFIVGIYITQTLFFVRTTPINPAPPPDFLTLEMNNKNSVAEEKESAEIIDTSPLKEVPEDFAPPNQIPNPVHQSTLISTPEHNKSIASGSLLHLVPLMKHEDHDVRAAAVRSFVGLSLLQREFWKNVGKNEPYVKLVLYEALADSVNNGTSSFGQNLLSTISRIPFQDEKTIEMIAWTSDNHPSPFVRDLAMYELVSLVPRHDITKQVIENRAVDPDLMVRIHAFGYRFERRNRAL